MSPPDAVAVYQHAIRRLAEPLTRRCAGPASPATVQRFVDQATGAALVLANALGTGAVSTTTIPKRRGNDA